MHRRTIIPPGTEAQAGRKTTAINNNNNNNNNNTLKIPIENRIRDRLWEEENYWFHEDIHTLGNTGVPGGLHAAMAPLSTKMIDILAYNGKNFRETIAKDLSGRVLSRLGDNIKNKNHPCEIELRVLDMGCGVGMSTRAMASAFRQQGKRKRRTGIRSTDIVAAEATATPMIQKVCNTTIIGVDTSPEMIAMARAKDREDRGLQILSKGGHCCAPMARLSTTFVEANAEATPFPKESFDLVTIQYVLHEVPFVGRHRILEEARRLLKPGGILAVVDISPGYQPSRSMLSGEPFVVEYQRNFQNQLRSLRGFSGIEGQGRAQPIVVVPGHVDLHVLHKADRWWYRTNGWIQRAIDFFCVHEYIWNRLRSSKQTIFEYSKH